MSSINVFIQGSVVPDIHHMTLPPQATIAALRKQWPDEKLLIFAEDGDQPLEDEALLADYGEIHRFHVHRCRHIRVTLCFNGKEVNRKFSPATTLARVKRWAARELGIERDDAAELVLQLPGGEIRPDPSTHLGSLIDCNDCDQKFDLVPKDRVNG